MKQRTITFVIILIVFLSIFSANYEVFNKIRSSELIQSKILKHTKEESAEMQKGICENSGAINALQFVGTVSSEIFTSNF